MGKLGRFGIAGVLMAICQWQFCYGQIIANDDVAVLSEDGSIFIDVQNNDFSDAVGLLFTSITNSPNHGVAAVFSQDSVQYFPGENYAGQDTIFYKICNDDLPIPLCDTARIFITVIQVNDNPIAVNDFAITDVDEAINIAVQDNDFDPDNDVLLSSIITNPANGLANTELDQSITYTPNSTFTGIDSFEYEICDQGIPNLCDRAWATIQVFGSNSHPIAIDDTACVIMNQSVSIALIANDSDPDGDNLFLADLITAPLYGNVIQGIDETAIYTPNVGYTGTDLFQYQVCDDQSPALCHEAWVHLEVKTLVVPNSFSPNGDGINDVLYVNGLEDYSNSELIVFNRWGEEIYQTPDYQNDWNGNVADGKLGANGPAPNGTYFYILNVRILDNPLKGYVVIKR